MSKAPEPGTAVALEIEVEAAIGFRASLDDDNLVIAQENSQRPEDPDNITLSRSEAKALFAVFGAWATGS